MADSVVNVVSTGQNKGLLRYLVPSLRTSWLIVYFIMSVIINGRVMPFVKRGFFCDDTTIVYPFKQNTICVWTLLLIAFIIPSIVIIICDRGLRRLLEGLARPAQLGARYGHSRKRRKISDEIDTEEENLMKSTSLDDNVKRRSLAINADSASYQVVPEPSGCDASDIIEEVEEMYGDTTNDLKDREQILSEDSIEFNQRNSINSSKTTKLAVKFFQRSFTEFQLFFFGCGTTMFLTGVGKITTGRLRPNFIQRCQPNIDCSVPTNLNRYIDNFTCSDKLKSHDLVYITTSWPSGHASAIFYSMLYLAIYLNTVIPVIVSLCPNIVKRRYDPLFLYAVNVLMMGLAVYIASTRVSDYHHHPTDVVSGSILGALNAIILARIYLVERYSL